MKNRTVRAALSLVLALVFVFSSAKTTYALWKVRSDTTNEITISAVQGQIIEEAQANAVVSPGTEVKHTASFKNTGPEDIAVRVKVETSWGSVIDGKFTPDSALAADNIIVDYTANAGSWLAKDGYYYYKGVLKPQELTPSLFASYRLGEETGNAYEGKQAKINVRLECVQAAGDGLSLWGITWAQLGVSYAPVERPLNTQTVTFHSPEQGFGFGSGGLFSSFSALLPGESYGEIMELKNAYSQTASFYLHAEEAPRTSAANQALLDQLLKEYAVLSLLTESGTVIYQGPIWGGQTADGSSEYFLGNFAPGQSGKLYVGLSLDKAVDNRYKNAIAQVRWVFSASGEGTEPPSTYPPPTMTSTTTQTQTSTRLPSSFWPTMPTTRTTRTTQTTATTQKPSSYWPTDSTSASVKPTWPSDPPKSTVPPKTGGSAENTALWACVMILSGLALAAVLVYPKYERRRAK
ncbi:MAG: hypothetical protein LBG83_06420 [Oscillospiraceae bacterium]|nr:hypothetical protein [Oscillospiraceae bacterium]